MAVFERRGKAWRVKVRLRGQSHSATRTSKAEAQAWADETERKIRAGLGLTLSGRTLADLFDRYALEVSPRKRSGGGWEVTRLAYYARDPLARTRLCDLTPGILAAWRDRRLASVTGGTLRRDMALLSHALGVATREWGWLAVNPMSHVRRPAENAPRDRRVSADDIERICHAAGWQPGTPAHTKTARVAAAFLFAIETGMRGGEIVALRRDHVRDVVAHLPRTKNGLKRDVALSPRARQLLLDVGGDWGDLTVRLKDALFRKLRKQAGVAGLNFHDSRHEAITRLARKLDVLALARMVGHRDLKMLQVYYNESAADLAKRLS
jgi:integrase